MEEKLICHILSESMDRLHRAEKAMRRAINPKDEPIFLLLHFSELASDGGVPISALKDTLGVSAAAATQFIKRLESFGYVTRETDQEDRRIVKITLTPQGRQKAKETKALFEKVLRDLINDLGIKDTQALIDLLDRTSAHMEKTFDL